ncbi:DUF3349 domain-containing protein [Dietzia sp.]|uniref:DUF3349 domain-containing protein n=1 Tax=Dietzia sp. TaxID=1871616 RepID=UPI002FD9B0BA
MEENGNARRENIFNSVLGWMREGYPEGIPPKDYFPLLALLKKELSAEQANQVIGQLLESRPDEVSKQQIIDAIEMTTKSQPTDEDVRNVAARLAQGGWPLSGMHE